MVIILIKKKTKKHEIFTKKVKKRQKVVTFFCCNLVLDAKANDENISTTHIERLNSKPKKRKLENLTLLKVLSRVGILVKNI